jgi:hypothetical protein
MEPTLISYRCPHCGKEYATPHHLRAHERLACTLSKQSLSDLLRQTKALWESKKRGRGFDPEMGSSEGAEVKDVKYSKRLR